MPTPSMDPQSQCCLTQPPFSQIGFCWWIPFSSSWFSMERWVMSWIASKRVHQSPFFFPLRPSLSGGTLDTTSSQSMRISNSCWQLRSLTLRRSFRRGRRHSHRASWHSISPMLLGSPCLGTSALNRVAHKLGSCFAKSTPLWPTTTPCMAGWVDQTFILIESVTLNCIPTKNRDFPSEARKER